MSSGPGGALQKYVGSLKTLPSLLSGESLLVSLSRVFKGGEHPVLSFNLPGSVSL